jgi:hypothetical protein
MEPLFLGDQPMADRPVMPEGRAFPPPPNLRYKSLVPSGLVLVLALLATRAARADGPPAAGVASDRVLVRLVDVRDRRVRLDEEWFVAAAFEIVDERDRKERLSELRRMGSRT